jgi:hypothetical protein
VKPLRQILFALAVFAPAKLFACAACYGGNIDSPLADGMNWAILTLGAIVGTVLAGFLVFFIRIMRKSEALVAAAEAARKQSQV